MTPLHHAATAALAVLDSLSDQTHAHVARDLRRALAAQPAEQVAWIPVTERMPEPDSGEVLVWLSGGMYALEEWHTYREDPTGMSTTHTLDMGCMWRTFDFEEVTHWMPLPSAPGAAAPQPQRAPVDDDPMPHGHRDITDDDPGPQPQRVPLTPAQVSHIADEAGYGTRDPSLRARFISGIRAAERAYGITPADLEEKSNG